MLKTEDSHMDDGHYLVFSDNETNSEINSFRLKRGFNSNIHETNTSDVNIIYNIQQLQFINLDLQDTVNSNNIPEYFVHDISRMKDEYWNGATEKEIFHNECNENSTSNNSIERYLTEENIVQNINEPDLSIITSNSKAKEVCISNTSNLLNNGNENRIYVNQYPIQNTYQPKNILIEQNKSADGDVNPIKELSDYRLVKIYGTDGRCYKCHNSYDKNSLFAHCENREKINIDKLICLKCSLEVDNIRHLRDWEKTPFTGKNKKCYRCNCKKSSKRFKEKKNICSYCVLKKKYVYLRKNRFE